MKSSLDPLEEPTLEQNISVKIPGDLSDAWLLHEMDRRGYDCFKRGERFETLQAASVRLGRHRAWLCDVLKGGVHPAIEIQRTPKGRAQQVRLTKDFEAWAATRQMRRKL